MMARISWIALTFVGLTLLVSCSQRVLLPEKVLGVWYEQKREVTLPDQAGQFEDLSGTRNVLRFEQQGSSAAVYGGEVSTAGDIPAKWSDPYALKQVSENSWSFERNGRDILVTLSGDGQLSVKGLVVRSQVTSFEKDSNGSFKPSKVEAKPIESIFTRKR